jgi:porphobilinogen synthase
MMRDWPALLSPATGRTRGPRPRRLRTLASLRDLVAETELALSHLVLPLFVWDRHDLEGPAGLPALMRRGVEATVAEAGRSFSRGVRAVLLFGLPRSKDAEGSEAWNPSGPVPRAIREIKRRFPELTVIADVCLCEYTHHGHCGVLAGNRIDNDETLGRLGRAAVAYAEAGADLVAPSAMMDHQVAAIRTALDDSGQDRVGILAYAAKFSSALYGPFRHAAGSAPAFGDRRSYQMDSRNRREALRELRLDAREGADVLMVKPALPYLDVLTQARAEFDLPLAAFQVSGEYAMIKAAAERGWLDERAAVTETLLAIRRAGADLVITYFAAELAQGAAERSA